MLMGLPTDRNSCVNRLCIVALVMAVCMFAGCKRQTSSPSSQTHFDTIKAAIARMLDRPEGAFLIVEDSQSGKYVQFVGSRDEPLILDLPLQALSADELTKEGRKGASGFVGVPSREQAGSERPTESEKSGE